MSEACKMKEEENKNDQRNFSNLAVQQIEIKLNKNPFHGIVARENQ